MEQCWIAALTTIRTLDLNLGGWRKEALVRGMRGDSFRGLQYIVLVRVVLKSMWQVKVGINSIS
jgi:hypothetical protein